MRICYDFKLKRPGCVLLAAVMGGDTGIAKMFDSDLWLISPTPDLKVYEVDQQQLKILLRISKKGDND